MNAFKIHNLLKIKGNVICGAEIASYFDVTGSDQIKGRSGMKALRTRTSTNVAFAALMGITVVFPGPVMAELSDVPIWNLWDGNIGNGGNAVAGDGAFASLCGAADCGGEQSKNPQNSPNDMPNDKGVALFRVDTTGPLRSDGTPYFNSAGTGHINPFLRFQHNENQGNQPYPGVTGGQPDKNNSGGIEAAYNTDDRSWPNNRELQADSGFANQAKDANHFNHSVRIGDLVQFDSTGKEDANGGYFGFWLDVNEPNAIDKRTILLDELEFFISDRADLNKYIPEDFNDPSEEPGSGTLAHVDFVGGVEQAPTDLAKKIWDMDFDNYAANDQDSICKDGSDKGCGGLLVDSGQASSGSGDFDMHVMLSVDLFKDDAGNNLLENSYVYLYNFMGAVDDSTVEASSGFEEWATVTSLKPPPPPPPGTSVSAPATTALMALGLVGFLRRRRSVH